MRYVTILLFVWRCSGKNQGVIYKCTRWQTVRAESYPPVHLKKTLPYFILNAPKLVCCSVGWPEMFFAFIPSVHLMRDRSRNQQMLSNLYVTALPLITLSSSQTYQLNSHNHKIQEDKDVLIICIGKWMQQHIFMSANTQIGIENSEPLRFIWCKNYYKSQIFLSLWAPLLL